MLAGRAASRARSGTCGGSRRAVVARMRARLALYLAAVLAAPACATDSPATDDGGFADADPSDFDSKADGISGTSTAVLKLLDGAHTRIYAQLPTLTDKTLLSHLK